MILRLFIGLVLFASMQSCNAGKDVAPSAGPLKPADLQVNNSLLVNAPPKTMEPRQYLQGEDLKNKLSAISVLDISKKQGSIVSFLEAKQINTIIYVKKGCVFCESLLATMANQKIKSNILIVTDQHHSTFEEFVQKQKDNKALNATWLFDFQNRMGDSLDFRSFPNILLVDGDAKVVAHQVGLKMLDNPDKLRSLSFPEALKELANNTVNWLKQF